MKQVEMFWKSGTDRGEIPFCAWNMMDSYHVYENL